MRLASQFNFWINPGSLSRIFGNLHVYSNMKVMGNTTPGGVEQPTTVYFYKHSMPPASLLPLTSVNGKETAPLTTGLQPHSMCLKPVTLMKSANRQLKQTAIKQTACPDFSGATERRAKSRGQRERKNE